MLEVWVGGLVGGLVGEWVSLSHFFSSAIYRHLQRAPLRSLPVQTVYTVTVTVQYLCTHNNPWKIGMSVDIAVVDTAQK